VAAGVDIMAVGGEEEAGEVITDGPTGAVITDLITLAGAGAGKKK